MRIVRVLSKTMRSIVKSNVLFRDPLYDRKENCICVSKGLRYQSKIGVESEGSTDRNPIVYEFTIAESEFLCTNKVVRTLQQRDTSQMDALMFSYSHE